MLHGPTITEVHNGMSILGFLGFLGIKVPPKQNPQLVHLGSRYRLAYPKKQVGHLPLPRSQEAYKVKEKIMYYK